MTVGQGMGQGGHWKDALGAIADDANERFGGFGAALYSSGFDGGAYAWSWRLPTEDVVEEVALRAAADPLNAGVQAQVLALARKTRPPFLAWSAATWTRHLGAEPHSDGQGRLSDEDLVRFGEELPDRLLEALEKARAVSPRLEELDDLRRKRRLSALDRVGHLLVAPRGAEREADDGAG